MRSRLSAAAFAVALLAGSAATAATGPAAAGATPEGDALAARVASMVNDDSKGVLGMMTESTQKLSAPIVHKLTKVRRYVVFQDGIPAAAGILSVVEDGKPWDAAQIAKLTAETDAKIKRGQGYNHQPYVAKFVREYHFANAPCEGCAPGERALAFDTDLHDDVHIAGRMIVDAADRPLRVTSHPYQYPSPASSGEATTTFGVALGAHRLPVDVHGLYFGHKGFIRGSFTFDEHNVFQRYPSVAEAVAALTR
jgi:hypothetical protein